MSYYKVRTKKQLQQLSHKHKELKDQIRAEHEASQVKSREIIVPNSANTFSSTQSIRPVVVIKSRGRHRSDSREGPRAIYFKVDMKFRTSMFSVLYERFYVRVPA